MPLLKTLLTEKLEKLITADVISHLTTEQNTEVIDNLVKAKKKDDRISIAANPYLTSEQFITLSNDKVNAVKEALCYNLNLPEDIARKLLVEEPERIKLLLSYAGNQLNNLILSEVPTEKWSNYFDLLVMKPKLNSDLLSKVLAIAGPKVITNNTGARPLFRRKDLDAKTLDLIFATLNTGKKDSDYPLTKLLNNQTEYFKEVDIKKMDWKTNPQIQQSILYRDDMSPEFVIDVFNFLDNDTSLSYLKDNKNNKNQKNPDVLNALLKALVKTDLYYSSNLDAISMAKNIPLDPKLLVGVVDALNKKTGISSHQYDAITGNVNYPDEGIDLVSIDSTSIKQILVSPNITTARASDLINKYVGVSREFTESILWGLAGTQNGKVLSISIDDQQKVLDALDNKSYFLEYICRGEFVDKVLKNPTKYSTYYDSASSNNFSVLQLYTTLARNNKLTMSQRAELIKAYEKEAINSNNNSFDNNFYTSITTHRTNSPELLMDMVKKDHKNIWKIWTTSGSAYFQYSGKLKDKIDEIALSTPDAPSTVITGGIGTKSFGGWLSYNNKNDDNQMTNEQAIKYLIHFIKTGDDSMIRMLTTPEVIEDKFMTPDVKNALYLRTNDEKYLPETVKDIFLF